MGQAAITEGRHPTYADIEALPDHLRGEILAGELVVSPRPAPGHAHVASVLGALLLPPFQLGRGGPGGWVLLHEPELALDVDSDFPVVVPDLAGWTKARMPRRPEGAQFTLAPDWVCEVLSPSTTRNDRIWKLPFYGRAGVSHAWIADPAARTVEVFVLEAGAWVLRHTTSEDTLAALPPFEAVELPLSELWWSGEGE